MVVQADPRSPRRAHLGVAASCGRVEWAVDCLCSPNSTPQLSGDVSARSVGVRLPPEPSAIHMLPGEEGYDMNRMRLVALCVAVSLGCFSTAFGIDLEDPSKAPATYVKARG
jgi:hypothetical protein